jgi:hypothetical protein
MSNLNAFLKPAYTEKKIEVFVGDRFLDENGNPVPIVMKSLTQEQLQNIAKRSTHEKKINGKSVYEIDTTENINRCIIASVISPDLTNKELCNAYGVEDPLLLPAKMFLIGEYETIAKAFATLNGLKSEDGDIRVVGEVTKN